MGDAPRGVWLEVGHATELAGPAPNLVFMGVLDEIAHFALDISHIEKPDEVNLLRSAGQFVDLRNAGALLDRVTGSLLAYARGERSWNAATTACASYLGRRFRRRMLASAGIHAILTSPLSSRAATALARTHLLPLQPLLHLVR